MIKVRISPPPFWKRGKLDERGWIELDDDARLMDALKEIKMPMLVARACMICINGTLCTDNPDLKEGDSIAFFPIPAGG